MNKGKRLLERADFTSNDNSDVVVSWGSFKNQTGKIKIVNNDVFILQDFYQGDYKEYKGLMDGFNHSFVQIFPINSPVNGAGGEYYLLKKESTIEAFKNKERVFYCSECGNYHKAILEDNHRIECDCGEYARELSSVDLLKINMVLQSKIVDLENTKLSNNCSCDMRQAIIDNQSSKIKELEATIDKFKNALTPSVENKSYHIGKYSITTEVRESYEYVESLTYDMKIDIPWTSIKDIMKSILILAGFKEL